jgi:hypothetical protein
MEENNAIEPIEVQAEIVSFDYNQFDQDTREFLVDRTSQIKSKMKQGAYVACQIGNFLLEVKEQLDHGQFTAWLNSEFDLSEKSAQRMMSVAKKFSSDNLSDLQIPTSALYLLSAPSTPEAAINEVLDAARQKPQHIFKMKDVEAIIKKYSSPTKSAKASDQSGRMDNPTRHDRHLTPQKIIDSVLKVFGNGIDLDPCAEELLEGETTYNVPARQYYTKEINGISKPWWGHVYCNPPYSGKEDGNKLFDWSKHLLEQLETDPVHEVLYLVPTYNGEDFWQMAAEACMSMCTIHPRLTFGGNSGSPRFGSTMFYFGARIDTFYDAFKEHGVIWQSVEEHMFGRQ